jgi:acyl-CoA dehydrogenase
MLGTSHLNWPFFEARHRALVEKLGAWARSNLGNIDHGDTEVACRELVTKLGESGWLKLTAPGDDNERLDVRSLALARETLARHDGLADFAFAMQGLGAGPISLFGSAAQRAAWLPGTRAGRAIAAFALTEAASGSDVANITTTARRDGDRYVIDGEKCWISNGGIADVHVVFTRTGEAPGARDLSAFIVEGGNPGLTVAERIPVIAPHPLARLKFDNCRVPADALVGRLGEGFKVAMATLDVFRTTVGAAALGFARRALTESLTRVHKRELFGAPMTELQMVQGHLADMAVELDAAGLLVYRAAWTKDQGAARVTREAAMAKLYATEAAQRIIDTAVQLHGGDGVRAGHPVEALYREIRALRIYEGASDVQKVIIARAMLSEFSGAVS